MRSDTELAELIEEYQNCFHLKFHKYPDISTRERGCLAQVLKRSEKLSQAIEIVGFYFTIDTDKQWFSQNAWSPEILLDKFNYVVSRLGETEHRQTVQRSLQLRDRMENLLWYAKNSLYFQDALGLRKVRDGKMLKDGHIQTDDDLRALLRSKFCCERP